MSLSYKKLFALMDAKGINKHFLRLNGFNSKVVDRLVKQAHVNTSTIEKLCALLDCQPGDIMEYVPDVEQDTKGGDAGATRV